MILEQEVGMLLGGSRAVHSSHPSFGGQLCDMSFWVFRSLSDGKAVLGGLSNPLPQGKPPSCVDWAACIRAGSALTKLQPKITLSD